MTDLRSQLQSTLGSSYTLDRELSGGGMSRVFVARDTTLERPVVVKVLSPELAAGVSAERFTRETKLAASLQQANIVPVLAAGATEEGLPYYTMPFVEGQSLRSRLAKQGALPITEVIGILRDVGKALAYAHERNVVHRDIKPDNVLLSGGTAVVTDFGIAKAISASRTESGGATLTQLGTSIGTPAYMAPEQAAGDPEVDHRADIYALGCMAFELLTSRPVFPNRTPQRMLAAHMGEVPQHVSELRPDTPAALAELVMKCLAKDAVARPQTASEIVRVLDTVTSGGSLPVMPPILIGGPAMFRKALAYYALSFAAVAIVAKASIVAVGLPEWVFPGAVVVMLMGLPVILFTGYVQRVTRRAITMTPPLTPGGTPSLTHGTIATIAMKASPHMSWRRAMMGGVYAVGVFIAMIGAFMLLRALGIGPAGSLLAAGKLNAREPLLVTDFKVTNADSTLGRVLSDATRAQLSQSSVITLLSPESIAAALRRMERPATSTLDISLARELAIRNGIKAIVDGEITGLGAAGSGGYIVSVKLVTSDSAKLLASFRETASDARGLIEAVDKLSRQVRGRIGESLRFVNAAPRLAVATTASLEALRKYSEGVRAENIEGKREQAIELLRQAVSIDSTFAEAWRKLAVVMTNAGDPRTSIDSALSQAYRYRHRLGESERDYITAAYYHNGPGRDRARAAAAYEAMLRRGETAGPANNLALLLSERREFARAESLYHAQERANPGGFRLLYGNLAFALSRQQRFASAESVVNVGLSRYPDQNTLKRGPVILLYLRGDTAAHRRAIDSAHARGDSADRNWARTQLANRALLDGKVTEWRRLVAQNRADPTTATPRQRLNWATNAGDAWLTSAVLKRPREVARRLDEALARMPLRNLPLAERPYLNVAMAYAWAGRTDKAREFLAQFDSEVKDTALVRDLQPQRALALAEILLAEGRGAEAAAEFRRADRRPDGPVDACVICLPANLSRAFDVAGMLDSAVVYHERAANEYGVERLTLGYDALVLAPYSRRLGELYEQLGDRAKAAAYYRNFVNLWRNADSELQPQVAEVRRRLSRLADVEGARR